MEHARENDNHKQAKKIEKHIERDDNGNPNCGKIGLWPRGSFNLKNKTPGGPESANMSIKQLKEMARSYKDSSGSKNKSDPSDKDSPPDKSNADADQQDGEEEQHTYEDILTVLPG